MMREMQTSGNPALWGRDRPTVVGLCELPREVVAMVVAKLPYAALPAFRTTCRLARELVNGASNGWVMKTEEGVHLQTSCLLQKLTALQYIWFEAWQFDLEQEANFLAVLCTNRSVFERLHEVRFPGSLAMPFRCMRSLLCVLPAVQQLALPCLPPDVQQDAPQYHQAFAHLAQLSTLTDLNLEQWALTDAAVRTLSGGALPKLRRLTLGSVAAMTAEGFACLARLTSLVGLTMTHLTGDNAVLLPMTELTELTGLRVELGAGWADRDAGPLAALPKLRSLGWWHPESLAPGALRPGAVGSWLLEVSLCVDLNLDALRVLTACSVMATLQVQSITLPPPPAPPEPPLVLPALPTLRTLIVGELAFPMPDEPEPCARLCGVFPKLENIMTFSVVGRGLQQLDKCTTLRRLVLHCQGLRDEALEFLPHLPTLRGLQLEGCQELTDSCNGALRNVPGLEQLLLVDVPAVNQVLLAELAGTLRSLRTLVLAKLSGVTDEAVQALVALAPSLEQLELQGLAGLTPAGLQVVHQLPRVNVLGVIECPQVDKTSCRDLGMALARAERDVDVEYEDRMLLSTSLADDFGLPPGARE